MERKKVDPRVKTLIDNGQVLNHRTFFVVIGDNGKNQVVNLHYMLGKSSLRARRSVLWCYKTDLGFSSNRQKRMKRIKKLKKSGVLNPDEDDPFELFLTTTEVRWTYYKDTHKILGNTYGMLVLQDFEAITPNVLARTIETVAGGGIIVLLLNSMRSLKQLYSMSMDIHSRFRTEAHGDVNGRFNERFLLSLISCDQSLIMDDQLNVLPISVKSREIVALPRSKSEDVLPGTRELLALKESLTETEIVGNVVRQAKTLDQAKAIITFIEAISEKTLRNTVALTSARGRGKSAALGLAVAAAIGYGYSNVFVTSPTPENLKTLFEFVFQGFDALGYAEHTDYELVKSSKAEYKGTIIRVNIFRSHRQVIQYIVPSDCNKLAQAELVVVDEAAAIPLNEVRRLVGPYLVFLSSTIHGYEGTGRSLSLKLIDELRKQSGSSKGSSIGGRSFREVTLSAPIRYSHGDSVEKWLNEVLCLDCSTSPVVSGCPHPSQCDLYYVNKDTLFSYHKVSERFLQQLMALYVSSHYKNSPNDLMLMADAPAHHIFALLSPIDENTQDLPDIFCVLQVCLEGEISKQTVQSQTTRGKRPSGDLIPWNISTQFQDDDFPSLSGARVVRIATHPDYQKMGYGSRALNLLEKYYRGEMVSDASTLKATPTSRKVKVSKKSSLYTDKLTPRRHLPPLLQKLTERMHEPLDYLGVSFGLTPQLFRFWRRNLFKPVYIRLTELAVTGEHSCIMLKSLGDSTGKHIYNSEWLNQFNEDFCCRFVSLLSYNFSKFNSKLAISILARDHQNSGVGEKNKTRFSAADSTNISSEFIERFFSVHDLKRFEAYAHNLLDYHAIIDLLPMLCRIYFVHGLADKLGFSLAQSCILLGLGLQHKSVNDLMVDLGIQANQILALFGKMIRKASNYFAELEQQREEAQLPLPQLSDTLKEKLAPNPISLDEKLREAGLEEEEKLKEKQRNLLGNIALREYAIPGNNDAWTEVDEVARKRNKVPNIVSVKKLVKEKSEMTEAFAITETNTARKGKSGKKRKTSTSHKSDRSKKKRSK